MNESHKEFLRQVQELLQASERRIIACCGRFGSSTDSCLAMGGTASSSSTSAGGDGCCVAEVPALASLNPDAILVVAVDVEDLATPTPARCSMEGPSRDSTDSRSASVPATAPATPTATVGIIPILAAATTAAASDGTLDGEAISGVVETPATCSMICLPGHRVDDPVFVACSPPASTEYVLHVNCILVAAVHSATADVFSSVLVPTTCTPTVQMKQLYNDSELFMPTSSQYITIKVPIHRPMPWPSFMCFHADGDETRPLPWPSLACDIGQVQRELCSPSEPTVWSMFTVRDVSHWPEYFVTGACSVWRLLVIGQGVLPVLSHYDALRYGVFWSYTMAVLTKIVNMFSTHPAAAVMIELASAISADNFWDVYLLFIAIWWFPSTSCKFRPRGCMHGINTERRVESLGALMGVLYSPTSFLLHVHLIMVKSKKQVAVYNNCRDYSQLDLGTHITRYFDCKESMMVVNNSAISVHAKELQGAYVSAQLQWSNLASVLTRGLIHLGKFCLNWKFAHSAIGRPGWLIPIQSVALKNMELWWFTIVLLTEITSMFSAGLSMLCASAPTRESIGSALGFYCQPSKFRHEAMLKLQLTSSGNSGVSLHDLQPARSGTKTTAVRSLFINMHSCQLQCDEYTDQCSIGINTGPHFSGESTSRALMQGISRSNKGSYKFDALVLSYVGFPAVCTQIQAGCYPSFICDASYSREVELYMATKELLLLQDGLCSWADSKNMTYVGQAGLSYGFVLMCLPDVQLLPTWPPPIAYCSIILAICGVWLLNHQDAMQILIGLALFLFMAIDRQEVFQGGRYAMIFRICYLAHDSSNDFLDSKGFKWDPGDSGLLGSSTTTAWGQAVFQGGRGVRDPPCTSTWAGTGLIVMGLAHPPAQQPDTNMQGTATRRASRRIKNEPALSLVSLAALISHPRFSDSSSLFL